MIQLIPSSPQLRVVCLGAHPDDIEIGCGGTLLSLADRPGCTVRGLVLTGTDDRAAEARNALTAFVPGAVVEVAGLVDGRLPEQWHETKEALEAFARAEPADLVLAPREDDRHQDHRLVGQLASTAWRDALILHYEIPKWDGDMGAPTHFVPLTRDQAQRKVELLNKHYPSQAGRDWWDDELFLGLLRIRGMECRRPYAEGFFAHKVLLGVQGGEDVG